MAAQLARSKFGPRICPHCKRKSRTTADTCLWCGKSLTVKA